MEDDGSLFVDDPAPPAPSAPGAHRWRPAMVVGGAVVVLAAVGAAAGLVVTSASPGADGAKHAVLSALNTTTDSGSFDFQYQLSSTPPTAPPPTTTSTGPCPARSTAPGAFLPGSSPPVGPTTGGLLCTYGPQQGADSTGPSISGAGTIDTNPFAMVATANIGNGSILVTVRVDGTDVYEDLGSLDGGLAPPADQTTARGQSLTGFSGITESTLGPLEGGIGLLDLANPTGYLDLSQAAVTSASETGTSTVDGVAITEYRVTVDASELAGTPGITPEESKTIGDALDLLHRHGYQSTTVDLSVDGSGYIRRAVSVATFSDGATATTSATFSDFGCAGTVLMPGQAASPTTTSSGCGQSNETGPPNPPVSTPSVPADTMPATVPSEPGGTVPTTAPPTGVPTTVSPPSPPATTATAPSSTTTTGA